MQQQTRQRTTVVVCSGSAGALICDGSGGSREGRLDSQYVLKVANWICWRWEWEGKRNEVWFLVFGCSNQMEGLPKWLNDKEPACQCRRPGFDPWVRKIPWRRKWQPTPIFSPGKSHGQRSLAGYNPWDHKESDTTEKLSSYTQLDAWWQCSLRIKTEECVWGQRATLSLGYVMFRVLPRCCVHGQEGCCRWEESGLRSSLKYCTYLRTGIITRGTRPGRMGECQGLSAGAETPRKSGVASRVQGELGEPVVLEATLTKHFKEQRSTAGVPRSIDAVSDRKPVVISVPVATILFIPQEFTTSLWKCP